MAEIRSTDPIDAYEFHRLHCIAAAEAWERAAETARLASEFTIAHACNQNAIRMRWLAEPDEELRDLFNAADRLIERGTGHVGRGDPDLPLADGCETPGLSLEVPRD